MLRGLGVIFYFIAGLALIGALIVAADEGVLPGIAIFAAAFSATFFGVICFAVDEIIQILRDIAGTASATVGKVSHGEN